MIQNILDFLKDYCNSLRLTSGPFFIPGAAEQKINFYEGEVILEVDEKTIDGGINLNDNRFVLYEYKDLDEVEELKKCSVKESIVIRPNSLRCLLISLNEKDKDVNETFSEDMSYKITKLTEHNLKENIDVLLINLQNLLNFNLLKDKKENYLDFIKEEWIKQKNIFVLEILNLDKILPQFLKIINLEPADFIRTNLTIINEKYNFHFCIYGSHTLQEEEGMPIKGFNVISYPFINDLLFFFESAQKIPFNHIKYLEYYHVLEYFATAFALKKQDKTLKKLFQAYLDGRDYEELGALTRELAQNLTLPVKDEALREVLERVDYTYIAEMVNQNSLVKPLKEEYLDVPSLFHQGLLDGTGKLKMTIDDEERMRFYNQLYNRVYGIRNKIVHSKVDFKKMNPNKFIPNKDNLKKIEADLRLIKILAYQLVRLECIEPNPNI